MTHPLTAPSRRRAGAMPYSRPLAGEFHHASMHGSVHAPRRAAGHRPIGALTCLLAAGLLAACGDGRAAQVPPSGGDSTSVSTSARQTRDAIAIGVALDPLRPGMQSIYDGVELAIERLNAEQGTGTPFALRRAAPNVRSAVQIATELRDDLGVVAVVGHPESGSTLEATPVYEDAEHNGANAVAAVSPTATSPSLTGKSDWIFRVCPTDITASEAVARYVVDSLRARRAAVIYRNDSYGRDWTKSFTAAYRLAGGTVVQRDPYLSGVTEWAAYALYMKQLGAEVLLFPGSVEDAELAIRAVHAAGADIQFIGGDATSGLEDKPTEFRGARYTAFFDHRLVTTREGRDFVQAYQRRFGAPPDQRAALAYDAALLIGRAVQKVGPDRRKVRDYLAQVGRGEDALEGVAGRIAFDEQHDVVDKPVVIATVGQE